MDEHTMGLSGIKIKVTCACDTCGNTMPIDKEKSNNNWTVYKRECECGGKATTKLSER